MSAFSWRRTTLGLLVAAPLMAFVLYRTNLRKTVDALAEANYALILAALVLFSLAVWLQAVRWRFLLKPLVDVPAHRLYPVVLIGHLGNSLLPLRGGEILRAMVLGQRESISRMATLGTVAVERVLDGLMLVALLLIFVVFRDTSEILRELVLGTGLLFGFATVVLIALAISEERSLRLAEAAIARAPKRWHENLQEWVASFLTGTRALRTLNGVAGVVITTAGFWAAVAFIFFIVGRAFDIQEGFGTYLLLTAASNLSLSIPVSQGGLGPFEFAVRQTLIFSGVASPLATAYALTVHAVFLIPMITLGLISLWLVGPSLKVINRPTTAGQEAEDKERPLATQLRSHQEHLPAKDQMKRGQAQIQPEKEP